MLGKTTALGGLPSHTHLIMGAGWDQEVSLVADIWGSVRGITLATYAAQCRSDRYISLKVMFIILNLYVKLSF